MTIGKPGPGKTDIEISPIVLGVNQFSGDGLDYRSTLVKVPEGETDQMVRAVYNEDINWFDTAEMYGIGRSKQGSYS